jgi:hypothetical protein
MDLDSLVVFDQEEKIQISQYAVFRIVLLRHFC